MSHEHPAWTYVTTPFGRIRAHVVHVRSRHRILALDDGRFAKTVRHSTDPSTHVWTTRNRAVWRHLSRFPHPGLLRVFERVVDDDGDEGFLCEGLRVPPLGAGTHPAAQTLGGFLHAAGWLAAAAGHMHRNGYVHGDLTPGNVCFRADGGPVIIDFDTSVKAGRPLRYPGESGREFVVLTPACCSPEHAAGTPMLPSSDVYCLAITMLSWISGRFGVMGTRPEQIETHIERCRSGWYPHWELVRESLDDDETCDLFAAAMRVRPGDRFADGADFAAAITRRAGRLSPSQHSRALLLPKRAPAPATHGGTTLVM